MRNKLALTAALLSGACAPEVDPATVTNVTPCIQKAVDAARDRDSHGEFKGFLQVTDRMVAVDDTSVENGIRDIRIYMENAFDGRKEVSRFERDNRWIGVCFPSNPEVTKGYISSSQSGFIGSDINSENANLRSIETVENLDEFPNQYLPQNTLVGSCHSDMESIAIFDWNDNCGGNAPFVNLTDIPTMYGLGN